jgi:hypothetical protein
MMLARGTSLSPVTPFLFEVCALIFSDFISDSMMFPGTYRSALNQVAEQALLDTVRFIFSNIRSANVTFRHKIEPTVESPGGIALGLPSAVKVLGFFVNILKKYTVVPSGKRGDKSDSSSNGGVSSASTSPSSPAGTALFGDAMLDSTTAELLLALKIINCMIVSEGDFSAPRETVLKCLPLASLIRDDLGLCLILLASKTELPPVVLESVLNTFSTLVMSLGPMLFVLVESFLVHVYLKGLSQLHSLLQDVSVFAENSSRVVSSKSSAETSKYSGYYSIELLEVILESLQDVLSEPGFLSMMFISFDCDPSRQNIFQPMFSYLCKCSRYVLSAEDSLRELGSLEVAANMTLQCLTQLVSALGARCAAERSSPSTGDGASRTELLAESNSKRYALSLRLRATRAAKKIMTEASKRFEVKPSTGLQFLQRIRALPAPLTPQAVANFLRLSPDLSKEAVGSYLGELGQDSPKFESEGKNFHRDVLISYVRSFPMSGQSILSCVRIFLSAFRLPGEAQQIDRILNAFSEHCFACCIEGSDGIVENPEVAYLLSFSIIMLNTDRHNVNIRADRKMTLEQFIRNNTNYGSDVKQTKPLPRDYLEDIYESISKFPLRTEKKDESGIVTVEAWLDAQQQASLDVQKGLLVTIRHDPATLDAMNKCIRGSKLAEVVGTNESLENVHAAELSKGFSFRHESNMTSAQQLFSKGNIEKDEEIEQFFHPNLDTVSEQAVKVVYSLLTGKLASDAFAVSNDLLGHQALIDADLAECTWKELIPVICSPFVIHRIPAKTVEDAVSSVKPNPFAISKRDHYDNGRRPSERSITIALGIAKSLMKISNWYQVTQAAEMVVMLLADVSMFLNGQLIQEALIVLGDDAPTGEDGTSTHSAARQSSYSLPRPVRAASTSGNGSFEMERSAEVLAKKCLRYLGKYSYAGEALMALLQMMCESPAYFTDNCWVVGVHVLTVLRDLQLLPRELVCSKNQAVNYDTLPATLRDDFELRMNASNIKIVEIPKPKAINSAPKRQTKSILSLQGLGEALFGSSEVIESSPAATRNPSDDGAAKREDAEIKNLAVLTSVLSRWDYGYSATAEDSSDGPVSPSAHTSSDAPHPSVDSNSDPTTKKNRKQAGVISNLRFVMLRCIKHF